METARHPNLYPEIAPSAHNQPHETGPDSRGTKRFGQQWDHYLISVQVVDALGLTAEAGIPVSVKDVNEKPTAMAGEDQVLELGEAAQLTGSASEDPDDEEVLGFAWRFIATPPESSLLDGDIVDAGASTASFVPDTLGEFALELCVTDKGGLSDTDTVTVTCDQGPAVTELWANPNPVPLYTDGAYTCVTLGALLCDPDPGATAVCAAQYRLDEEEGVNGDPVWYVMEAADGGWDSPDEEATTTFGLESFGIVEPGVHTVAITGTDGNGFTGPEATLLFAVYDPSAGFVTGGGWIWSPAGAYAPDPDLEGKANFGFVAKYKKGANVPEGNTEFRFKAGDLNFHSSEYEWLVVAGAKAMFKGVGTINGAGAYKFMISAIDGDLKEDLDRFRIRIWYEEAGAEIKVYDNQFDAPLDEDATTALGGGSIIIHRD